MHQISLWLQTQYWGWVVRYQYSQECSPSGGICDITTYGIINMDTDFGLSSTQERWLVAHELGHLWGFNHFGSNCTELMCYPWISGIATTPNTHAGNHIAEIYP